jgi:P27 family predicted phage terminase small subunit
MAGRKREPTALKLLKGNPGRRRLNEHEPEPERVIPSPPAHLPASIVVYWGYFADQLDRMDVLTRPDAPALERLCRTYAEVVRLDLLIDELSANDLKGETYKAGEIHRGHPLIAMRADADRRFQSWCREFGLTPSARPRLQVTKPARASDPGEKHFA